MRKVTVIGMVVFFLLTSLYFTCFAQSNEEEEKGKFSANITIKNDFGFPKEGKDYTVQALSAYWCYGWFKPNVGIGGGVDLRANFKDDFLEASPYITLNHGPWYVLVGGVIDSKSQNFVQAGIWYIDSWQIKKIGKFNIILDVRNYWPVEGKNLDPYIDNFLEITYPIGKFFIGTDLEYAHWWEGPRHDYLSVGPLFGLNVSKNVSIFVRPTHDWDFTDETKGNVRVRLGLKLSF